MMLTVMVDRRGDGTGRDRDGGGGDGDSDGWPYFASKQTQCDGNFDVFMSIDRWRNRTEDSISNVRLARQLTDHLTHILISTRNVCVCVSVIPSYPHR